MHDYAILFTYYGGAHPEVMAQNLDRLRRFNPGVPIIPLIHDGEPTIEGTVDLRSTPCPWDTGDKWRSCDTMIYRWFPDRTVRAQRYVLCEWDTYSTTSIREFYAPVWDADVAAVEAFTHQERPDWWFFSEIPLLGDLAPFAGAVVPFSGTLFSAAALEAICRGPMLRAPFCELRIATLARHAGLRLTPMPFAEGFISFRPEGIRVSDAPGIYHPVKKIVSGPAPARPAGGEATLPTAEIRKYVAHTWIDTHTDILNLLAWYFELERYLEVGLGEAWRNLELVNAPLRHSVGPCGHATYPMTSDQFFAGDLGSERYDLILVDGLHETEQCLRDIENALGRLSSTGFIVVHDANPPTEWHQRPPSEFELGSIWNGTVWKAIVAFRQRHPELMVVTVDVDWGCTVIRAAGGGGPTAPLGDVGELTWSGFESNRKSWLNLITVDELRAIILDLDPDLDPAAPVRAARPA